MGGTFFTLEDDRIAFFNPEQFKKFRTMLLNGSKSTLEILHVWNPKTHGVSKIIAEIRFEDQDIVKVDGEQVTLKSLNRLRLSRNWRKVLQSPWPSGCSILHLGKGRFLISGGNKDEDSLYVSKVTIYNAEKGCVEKEFDMNYGRVGHSAILLSNGKVFCIGGTSSTGPNHSQTRTHSTNSAEIIDVTNGTSVTLDATLPVGLSHAVVCTDENGDPLIFGGFPESKGVQYPLTQIVRYDLRQSVFREVGAMKTSRYFERPADVLRPDSSNISFVIEDCAERLTNGQYILDGGSTIQPRVFSDFASGSTCGAEIISLIVK